MLGKCLRALCVLLAVGLLLLAVQGASASIGLIRTSDLFCVGWEAGRRQGSILSEEDGLYISLWARDYSFPSCPFEIEFGQNHDPLYGRDRPPRSVLGWPGYVYRWDFASASAVPHEVHREAWVPRLPVAGLLMLWPVIHWVRARRRKKLARVSGFPLEPEPPAAKKPA